MSSSIYHPPTLERGHVASTLLFINVMCQCRQWYVSSSIYHLSTLAHSLIPILVTHSLSLLSFLPPLLSFSLRFALFYSLFLAHLSLLTVTVLLISFGLCRCFSLSPCLPCNSFPALLCSALPLSFAHYPITQPTHPLNQLLHSTSPPHSLTHFAS